MLERSRNTGMGDTEQRNDPALTRKCRECGQTSTSGSIFAYGHFPAAAAILVAGVTVGRALNGIHVAVDGTILLGMIVGVFSVPALARRFDACPQCKKRDWESLK